MSMSYVVDNMLAEGEALGIVRALKSIGEPMVKVAEMVTQLMGLPKDEAEAKVKAIWDTI